MTLQSLPENKVSMGTGLFSVAREISGTLGVALTVSFLEYQRVMHAVELAQQPAFVTLPPEWATQQLQHLCIGIGDAAGLAQVKATAVFHRWMMAESTVSAYQDIFVLSGFISVFNLLPAVLRRRRRKPTVAEAPSAMSSEAEEATEKPSSRP